MSNIVKQWISTPNPSYRNNKPEGVVAHYTANENSTLAGEVSYMTRAWYKNKAYVHAFAGHAGIIETSNPDFGCWGAGGVANKRYVQVELVVSHNKADFDIAFNNYCWLLANYLYRYGLPVTPAQPDGTGTVWTHSKVTKYLGDTNHTDPDEYLSRWGQNYDTMFAKIARFYAELGGSVTVSAPSVVGTTAQLQQLLKQLGFRGKQGRELSVDGDFGPNTEYAVRLFQITQEIKVDGDPGKETWGKLLDAVARPISAHPRAVSTITLQRYLNLLGYVGENGKELVADGKLGANSVYAVRTYQAGQGISVDGKPGSQTWGRLRRVFP